MLEIKINQMIINRQRKDNLTPLENLFPLQKNLITAQNLLYAQNHVNYLSFTNTIKQGVQTLTYPKGNRKLLLSQTIFIKETFLSIPKYNPLLLRSFPGTPIFSKCEHRIENPEKFLEISQQNLKKPIREREIYQIEQNKTFQKLSINPLDPLLEWLFLDQSDNFIACAKKHEWREVFFHFPPEEANPYIRGLWLSPLNDYRAYPLKEEKVTPGAYRYGSEFLYYTI